MYVSKGGILRKCSVKSFEFLVVFFFFLGFFLGFLLGFFCVFFGAVEAVGDRGCRSAEDIELGFFFLLVFILCFCFGFWFWFWLGRGLCFGFWLWLGFWGGGGLEIEIGFGWRCRSCRSCWSWSGCRVGLGFRLGCRGCGRRLFSFSFLARAVEFVACGKLRDQRFSSAVQTESLIDIICLLVILAGFATLPVHLRTISELR
jgi:hypothetical protein